VPLTLARATSSSAQSITLAAVGMLTRFRPCPLASNATLATARQPVYHRLGYAAGPKEIVDAMAKVRSHTTSHPASISQVAAQAALADSEGDVRRMAAKFAERREVIVEGIGSLPGVTLVPPAGAFYVYPNVAGLFGREIGGRTVRSGQDVAEALLAAARIAVVPGEAFGTTHHVRLSFACSMSRIREGIARLQAALA